MFMMKPPEFQKTVKIDFLISFDFFDFFS